MDRRRNGDGRRWERQPHRKKRGPNTKAKEKIFSSEAIAQAILDTRGVVAKAAKKVGMTAMGLWKRVHKEVELQEALVEARELLATSDAMEGIIKQAKEGDMRACNWILSKWGARLGLTPPSNDNVDSGRPVVVLQINEMMVENTAPKQVPAEVSNMLEHINEIVVEANNTNGETP